MYYGCQTAVTKGDVHTESNKKLLLRTGVKAGGFYKFLISHLKIINNKIGSITKMDQKI